MSIPIIAFFTNKGGVGKTSLVYHLSWMCANLGLTVVAADLDPQENLTASFLSEEQLEDVYATDAAGPNTIFGAVRGLKEGTGDVVCPRLYPMSERLTLVVGDMDLSRFEDDLAECWSKCGDGDPRAFRVTSAFYRVLQLAAREAEAQAVLLDLGPNLGAINRAALVASDCVILPLGPDLFSLRGMHNLGPALTTWRRLWQKRLQEPPADLELPEAAMRPLGYVVLRHSIRLDRPVQAFERWLGRIPDTYAQQILGRQAAAPPLDEDPNCLAKLRDYRSLMPLAQEARKPIFDLKPADGALGAHTYAVGKAYDDFKALATVIADRAGLVLPQRLT